MNPRNMLYSNGWPIEFEVAQQMPNHHHQEPYILHGGSPNIPQSNSRQISPVPGSIPNFEFYHLPEHHDGTTFYRMPQYAHQFHPATNLELGMPTPSNFYNPYMNPAIGRMFSASQNYGASSAHVDGYGRNVFAPDGVRGLSKTNIAESYMGSIQYLNAPAASSSSMSPSNACHFDGDVAVVDGCFTFPEYRGNYFGQSFQPPARPNVVGDGSTSSCDPSSMPSNFEGSNITASSSEIGNAGGQRFHVGASTSRASTNLMHSTPMLHVLHDFHHLQSVQGANGYNLNYHLPAVAPSSRHSINNAVHHVSISHTQRGPESVPPAPGIRIYRSHRGGTPEGLNRYIDLPQMRLLPEEGLAILELPGHYEMGMESPVDHHRDMRLDIDYMSYEELLALSERIGNADTGLSDEAITCHLKTRVYRSSMATIDLEELSCNNETNDSCVICQDKYEDGDNTGNLDCGHEYHVNCLKKWLWLKNTCPICKSTALDLERKDGKIR